MVTGAARPGRLAAIRWAWACAAIAASAAACSDFEDPAQVVDMRVLGMRADPPEILVPYDPDDPTRVEIGDLGQVTVCALVADPADRRGLDYSFAFCRPTSSGRCRGSVLAVEVGAGSVEDPEESGEPVQICATVSASPDLAVVLMDSLDADSFLGFGGISLQIGLEVTPEGSGSDDTLFAFKRIRYAPEFPAGRTPNTNPSVTGFIGLRTPTGERGLDFEVPIGRCGDVEPFTVAPGERVSVLPVEPAGARERYVVATFDGGENRFTENLTYQWHASEGDWSPFESGGTIDVAGNEPTLDARWRAPTDRELIGDGLDVRMWIVQRDERGGQAWYETCARVVP
ncbi:MAG TPA: hypothetical protein VK698_27005 [Kofleriaceae bacterium]|nr:hypothetical protein [Kofleriaceae bacterium]